MRALTWIIPALALALPSFAGNVYEAHDKRPTRAALGNACDGDAHDPAKCKALAPASVPEPATFPLLVLGGGILWIVTRRRKP